MPGMLPRIWPQACSGLRGGIFRIRNGRPRWTGATCLPFAGGLRCAERDVPVGGFLDSDFDVRPVRAGQDEFNVGREFEQP